MAGDDQTTLLVHAVLVGLTALIPLPLADDLAKTRVQRRLVRALAAAHELALDEAAVRTLADDPPSSLAGAAVKTVLLAPVRFLVGKAFLVVSGKRLVDQASDCYHRGWLVALAFAEGLCAPSGPHAARDVRAAIDAIVGETPLAASPVTSALRTGFERSRDTLARMGRSLRARFAALVGADAPQPDAALDDVVARLREQVGAVPPEHFEELARRLRARLAVERRAG